MWQHNGAMYNVKGEDARICAMLDDTHMLIGIADGHGGPLAARTCRKIAARLTPDVSDAGVEELFRELHAECLALPCASGAALTVIVLDVCTGRFMCANCGDSGAILVTPTSHLWLTVSHRLQDNATERGRLAAHVGFVDRDNMPVGPPRLFPGGLACSRSIGDRDCVHIVCTPAICRGVASSTDVFVVASDGLWDAMSTRKIADVARTTRSATELLRCKRVFDDDTSVIVASALPCVSPLRAGRLFGGSRNGSSSSLSSDDDDTLPRRTIISVDLSV